MEKTRKLEWAIPKLVRLGSSEDTEGQNPGNCRPYGNTAGGVCEYTGQNATAGCNAGTNAAG